MFTLEAILAMTGPERSLALVSSKQGINPRKVTPSMYSNEAQTLP